MTTPNHRSENMWHRLPARGRRRFLGNATATMSGLAMASLLDPEFAHANARGFASGVAKAKRIIDLFQSGGPAQQDLYDYKPYLDKVHGEEMPASVFQGQRLTGMTAGQSSFPIARSTMKFQQHGQSGAWISEVMPRLAEVADELCFVKSHAEFGARVDGPVR